MQKAWDFGIVETKFNCILQEGNQIDVARIHAENAQENGQWLHAIPVPSVDSWAKWFVPRRSEKAERTHSVSLLKWRKSLLRQHLCRYFQRDQSGEMRCCSKCSSRSSREKQPSEIPRTSAKISVWTHCSWVYRCTLDNSIGWSWMETFFIYIKPEKKSFWDNVN